MTTNLGHPMAIVLNDHLAGAAAVIPMAERCRDRHPGTDVARVLDGVIAEIKEDKQALERLVEALGLSVSVTKQAIGWVTEKMGRLRLIAAEQQDDGAGTLLELQAIIIGIEGKRLLWEALDVVRERHPALAATNFVTLNLRAQRQQDHVRKLHDEMARQTLHI